MPLPTITDPIAPMTDAEAARPGWLRGAPQIAVSAWDMVAELGAGESLDEAEIFAALGIDGRKLPVEVASTLVAAGLGREYSSPDELGRCIARWRRPPWRAPAPCRRCGRV